MEKEIMVPLDIKTVDVYAVEYYDGMNGNSYFDAKVIINYGTKSEINFLLPLQYGYENKYKEAAFEALKNKGFITTDDIYYQRYYADNSIVARHAIKSGVNYQQRKKSK